MAYFTADKNAINILYAVYFPTYELASLCMSVDSQPMPMPEILAAMLELRPREVSSHTVIMYFLAVLDFFSVVFGLIPVPSDKLLALHPNQHEQDAMVGLSKEWEKARSELSEQIRAAMVLIDVINRFEETVYKGLRMLSKGRMLACALEDDYEAGKVDMDRDRMWLAADRASAEHISDQAFLRIKTTELKYPHCEVARAEQEKLREQSVNFNNVRAQLRARKDQALAEREASEAIDAAVAHAADKAERFDAISTWIEQRAAQAAAEAEQASAQEDVIRIEITQDGSVIQVEGKEGEEEEGAEALQTAIANMTL